MIGWCAESEAASTRGGTMRSRWWRTITVAFLPLLVCGGCQGGDELPPDVDISGSSRTKVDLFELAWDNLERLSEYAPQQPLEETVARLNQWAQTSAPEVAWQVDPLLDSLPADLINDHVRQRLASSNFVATDGPFLQEAVLMRRASAFIVGDATDPLEQAQRLFDWTIRNIQLDNAALRMWPGENLLLGRASELDRGWVFAMLARQRQLDVVWLAIAEDAERRSFRIWCPALLHDGELYPFDVLWGVAMPTATGEGVATLADLATDDKLLRQLDVSGLPYPVRADELSRVLVIVPAREPFLSRRMQIVAERLPKRLRTVLHIDLRRLADELAELRQVGAVRLWIWPFQYARQRDVNSAEGKQLADGVVAELAPFFANHTITVEARKLGDFEQAGYERTVWPLWSGRVHHLAGNFTPPVEEQTAGQSFAAAIPLYLIARTKIQDRAVLPEGVRLSAEEQAAWERRQALDTYVYGRMQLDATYWLGQIRFDQGDYATAAEFFQRTLNLLGKRARATGVRYNLARAYEALGDYDKAIEQFEAEGSPASQLRARRLAAGRAASSASDAEASE